MEIQKQTGVTPTERYLSELCEKTFLKLWSYPNPFKDDGDEFCDLLAVFENNIFIFFDRESLILNKDENTEIQWKRWKKKVIEKQILTAKGAEAYLRRNSKLYLDKNKENPFPIKFDINKSNIYKIIVAHGAEAACKKYSDRNINGSLAIIYSKHKEHIEVPFLVTLERDNPVHLFDSYTLPILLNELDTFFDFSSYLEAKNKAIKKYELVYCGEEDLLAHYYSNFDEDENIHFIGTNDEKYSSVMIEEGQWEDFKRNKQYLFKKDLDKISYIWDKLIQNTSQNALEGILLGDNPLKTGKSAIHEMAKEPRFHRRELSKHIMKVINEFPITQHEIMRHVTLMPSFYKEKAYVFFQLEVKNIINYDDYRKKRARMLEIACGIAKNKNPDLKLIIGIATFPPKLTEHNSEDLLLLECDNWTEELKSGYDKDNELLGFFKTENIKMHRTTTKEFPDITKQNEKKKIGRNDPCPCGSGKKYKKCCMP